MPASSDKWLSEYTYPTPRRVESPMSHTQPAERAVEIVAEAIGVDSSGCGTCTAHALLTNSTSFLETNGTPKCFPINSDAKPLQSMNRSPGSVFPARVSR